MTQVSQYKFSPSYKYKIEIGEKEWVVKRCQDQHVICRRQVRLIPGASQSNFIFFQHQGAEWLYMTGEHLVYQMFVNLETGDCYDNNSKEDDELSYDTEDDFYRWEYCWLKVIPNLDGTILAVKGLIWGFPYYEIQFYDFSNPTQGWSRMKIEGLTPNESTDYCKWIQINGVEVFEYTRFSEEAKFEYRLHFIRDGKIMKAMPVDMSYK